MTVSSPSDNYSIVWVRYDHKEGGCITHALADDQERTMCGLAAPECGFEGGVETLTTIDGHVGCQRCRKALTKRGILPFKTALVKDEAGDWITVAV